MRTLVKGGTVVTAADERLADVVIEDGRIAAVEAPGVLRGERVLDARGRYVLPGAVDPHTHIDTRFRAQATRDDFTTGTLAAACGGTTSVIDFCFPQPGATLNESLDEWHGKLEAHPPVIDVGVHMALVEPGAAELAELPSLRERGVTSLKLFMAYKARSMSRDTALFGAMSAAAENGLLVMVHAENGDVIDVLVARALAAGHTSPRWHARTRPPVTESEAVHRAIALAELAGCDLYVVHVSCREALAEITRARAAGASVFGETCPQYLVLDETGLDAPLEQAAQFVFTPPPRPAHHQGALWAALAADELAVIASDHCPFDLRGQKTPAADFTQIMNGAPGVEQRLVLAHEFGVRRGHFGMSRLVELTSTNPARLFGLAGKGRIAPGADADVVIFDPERRLTLSARTHHSRVDHLPYEGIAVTGAPETVLVRGEVVVAGGEPVADPPRGRFLAREPRPLTVRTYA
jgi:dihydropyrimidinase